MSLEPIVGSKFDQGKTLMGCIPPTAERIIADVLTFGANKYGRDNWQRVPNFEVRYMDACLRHINAHRRGEELDPESGLPHLAHATCCLMFLLQQCDFAVGMDHELNIGIDEGF